MPEDNFDPLSVPCPTCGAAVGEQCRSSDSVPMLVPPHAARLEAADRE